MRHTGGLGLQILHGLASHRYAGQLNQTPAFLSPVVLFGERFHPFLDQVAHGTLPPAAVVDVRRWLWIMELVLGPE